MIRMRKLAAYAATAALVLAACGGDDDSDTDTADDTEAADPAGDDTDTADDTEGADAAGDDAGTADDTEAGVAGVRGELLTLSMIARPLDLSASQAQFGNNNLWYQTVYDSLLLHEPDSVTVLPHLATDWEYDDTNTVLTMTLRDDVTFSDGTPFDADAAAQNIIRNRDNLGAGASRLFSVDEAVAVDATTLELTLNAPDPALVDYLAGTAGLMQSPATFDAPDESTNPVGTGPYLLDLARTTPDAEYVYTAREDYWAPELQHWDEIGLRVIDDGTALVNAILAGELNGSNLIDQDASPEIEAAGYTLHTHELDWRGLSLIDRDGAMGTPLDNKLVRQAISHVIDREAFLEGIGGGYGTATQQVFKPTSPGFDPALDERYPYDPELARELMDESGVGPFTMTQPASFAFFGESFYAILADALSEIGITLEFEEPGPGEFISDLLAPKYASYFMQLEQSPNDWQFINFLIAPTATWNPGGATDDTVVDLIEQIQYSEVGAERDALVAELGQHISEEAWYVPFYRLSSSYVTDDTVTVTLQNGNAVPYLWNFVPTS